MSVKSRHPKISTVLFDLDGTLIDTAPDLINALNTVLEQHHQTPIDPVTIKPFISTGAAGMLTRAWPLISEQQLFDCTQQLVAVYKDHIADQSRVFKGIDTVLESLEKTSMSWGVVTNKRSALTQPLMEDLQLATRAQCIISSDTTDYCKPHPAPLMEACRQIGTKPAHCLYIGDAKNDIIAAQRAAMPSLVAAYGYLNPNDEPQYWGATDIIHQPVDILPWLQHYNEQA